MAFTLTEEQEKILAFVRDRRDHLMVEARAGAAKTSTLVFCAEAIPERKILCLAFNAGIRDEMRERMPSNVNAMTIHGCGFDAFRRYIGRSCRVNSRKIYSLLREQIDRLEKLDQDDAWDTFSETMKAISTAKNAGTLFQPHGPNYRPLISPVEFFADYDYELSPLQQFLIEAVCKASWKKTLEGELDFDDMLLAPAVSGVSFPFYSEVFVDEAQDLAPINHHLLTKIVKANTRLVSVGDPCQAIYGFRGADTQSMNTLQTRFSSETLYLTTSFRCARTVVEEAKWRAPDMRASATACEGRVVPKTSWGPSDMQDGDAVICRNNAPLFSLALQFIKHGLRPEIMGRDVIGTLTKQMKKLGKPKTPQPQAMALAEAWAESEKRRDRNTRRVDDTLECMLVFIRQTETLGQAIELAEVLAAQKGRIFFMTGHRSKGLEFRRVFFLDRKLISKEEQDLNICYVIQTRAKEELYYVDSDTFTDETDEPPVHIVE